MLFPLSFSLEHTHAHTHMQVAMFNKQQRQRVELLLSVTPRKDATGRVIGVIGISHCITERKRAESLALELQAFIDTANAPIFGIDPNGLVNEWNFKTASITGYTRMEVLGRNLVQVRGPTLPLSQTLSGGGSLLPGCASVRFWDEGSPLDDVWNNLWESN